MMPAMMAGTLDRPSGALKRVSGLRVAPRLVERDLSFAAMGGTVSLRVAAPPDAVRRAERDLRLLARRIEAWADRLTRFREDSELSALNRAPCRRRSPVGPTLAAVLSASRSVAERTEGIVDVSLLEARLAAEDGRDLPGTPGRWWLTTSGRRHLVRREGRVVFDLDGVGKGWIADRALASLRAYPAAMVDADGDVALRVAPGIPWQVAIADPRPGHEVLALLDIPERRRGRPVGISTSGTSVHRWQHADGWRHHLIDPRTGRPAHTDVLQATVMAGSALAAEALAKSAVISGSDEGLDLLERAAAEAEVLLLASGEAIATMRTLDWLH